MVMQNTIGQSLEDSIVDGKGVLLFGIGTLFPLIATGTFYSPDC